MMEDVSNEQQELLNTLNAAYDFSTTVLVIYTRLWQLETWLRQLVYVELSAKYGDQWHTKLPDYNPRYAQNDQRLTHMPIPEELPLSYVTFSSVTKAIIQEWDLFKTYLPTKTIWEAKIEEVAQIRNRVAHFRSNHVDDLPRLIQLLRDIDNGIWRFCVSMNSAPIFNAPSDPNAPLILTFGDPIPDRPILNAHRSLPHEFMHLKQRVELCVRALRRPWTTEEPTLGIAGLKGWIYDVNIRTYNGWKLDYKELISSIRSLSSNLIYAVFYSKADHLRILIPAVSGEETCKHVITNSLLGVSDALTRNVNNDNDYVQRLVKKAPEYIIDNSHPIDFLTRDKSCSIFGV